MVEPTVIYWTLMVLIGVIGAIGAVSGIVSRKQSDSKDVLEKLGTMQTSIEVGNADARATRETVSDLKAELKSHGDQLQKMGSKLSETDQTAREALSKANAAHERMDVIGVPSAYAARVKHEGTD